MTDLNHIAFARDVTVSVNKPMSEKSRVNILLVDDQPGKLLTYKAVLEELDETLITADSAKEAFNQLLRHDFAVVLVDVCMPELDGYQLATLIREHPRFEKTPIIFISAIYLSDIDHMRGYASGAVDYVPVPVVPEILRAKVRIFVELHRKTRELERLNRELEERVAHRTTELRAANEKLAQSEERLRLASEAAEFGTYECDLQTGRIYCSSQMKHLLDCEIEGDLHLDTFLNFVHPGDKACVRRYMTASEDVGDQRHEVEFRVVRADGSIRWLLDCGRAYSHDDDDNKPFRVMGTVLDVTERKQVEERQLLLMAELDHRVKNILANVGAIARLSSKRATSVDDFVKSLDARIQAVAKAHSLLRQDSWIGINLQSYIEEILSPYVNQLDRNLIIQGPPLSLLPKAAQAMALAIHELATNAAKYGALTVPDGKVQISWIRLPDKGDGVVKLTWKETGGPPAETPKSSGFGLNVIKMAAAELDADISHEFDHDGVTFSFEAAIEQITLSNSGVPERTPASIVFDESHQGTDRKFRVLIVEDEAPVALQVKHELELAGHKIAGLGMTLAQGLQLAESSEFDVAFLDIRLGDQFSAPIAERLLTLGIPFAFGTGFGDDTSLPIPLRSIPTLAKPYTAGSVSRLLQHIYKAESSNKREAQEPLHGIGI